MEKIAASVAFGILVTGVVMRKNRRIHPLLMATGIGLDTFLVLLLQFQRSVIQEAMTESFTLLQSGHILSSTIAFALYFPVVALGVTRLLGRGGPSARTWHIRVALTAFTFRTIGFVLMFSI